jgi:DNA processing protein
MDWLRLTRTESIGPLTFKALINRFGGASAALEALPALLRQRGKAGIRIPSPDDIRREIDAGNAVGARFVALGEPDYPPLLRKIDSAPPVLVVKGNVEVFKKPFVAIVGSRNASAVGKSFTDTLAKGLTAHGFAVASGLARGIDTRAHEASLGFGTVAVLAGGLDKPYPAENMRLLERICDTGAVISEMPMGWEPRGRDFPRRNRIISGLAYGSVIVEAARRSGSLITARFANEQGREVFSVPGSPLDPRAEGTNDLLRQGANLCAGVDDVVRMLAPMVSAPDLFAGFSAGEEPITPTYRNEPLWEELLGDEAAEASSQRFAFAEPEEPAFLAMADAVSLQERVLEALGPSPLDVDELARMSTVPLRDLHAILLDLDLEGRIERHGGNRVSLKV